MAIVGQLFYNLRNYYNDGSVITSSNLKEGGLYNNFFDSNTGGVWNSYQLKKLGIQAPPGVKIQLGTSESEAVAQTIIIGRNGIYEFEDESVRIKYFRFIEQYKYVLDEAGTNEKLQEGQNYLKESYKIFTENCTEIEKDNYYKEIDGPLDGGSYYVTIIDGENVSLIESSQSEGETILKYYIKQNITGDYWEKYDIIFNKYIFAYEEAYGLYLQGVNGVYKQAFDSEGKPILIDPYDVIIDYVAETAQTGGAN